MMNKCGIIIMLLVGLLIGVTACGSSDKEATGQHAIDNNNVAITADGNIDALYHAKLTFGSGGKVADVTVSEGDRVSKGDMLAKLDTDALELAETQAQLALTQVQLALTQAKLAERTAEANLKTSQDMEGDLELALANAQIDVKTAKFDLEQTSDLYTWSDIKTAKADVDNTQRYLDELLEKVGIYLPEEIERASYPTILEFIFGDEFTKVPAYELWQDELIHAQSRLNMAQDRLDAMLTGSDPQEVAIKRLQLETAEKAEAQAWKNLDNLNDEVAIKALEVELSKESTAQAQQDVNYTQKSLTLAQKYLAEATIVAPFDGIVAKVGVEEGEFLSSATYTGTTIIELINLEHMEMTARFDELDVVKVKTGQKVMVCIDAVPETILEGWVTFISPVARESGVVLFEDEDEEKEYEVRIGFNIPENSPIRAGMSATAEIIVE